MGGECERSYDGVLCNLKAAFGIEIEQGGELDAEEGNGI
jgi:hypothetical protein